MVKQTAETGELGTLVGVNTANGCLLACFDRLFTPSEACVAGVGVGSWLAGVRRVGWLACLDV